LAAPQTCPDDLSIATGTGVRLSAFEHWCIYIYKIGTLDVSVILELGHSLVGSYVVTMQKFCHLIMYVCCRKVLSADTEATKQNLTKEEENQSCVHEGSSGDSTCSSSVNMSSQKPEDSEICTENVEKGLMPNLESAMTHTKDNTPDIIETLTSVSQADAGCLKSSTTIAYTGSPDADTNTDTHSSALCSATSAENSSVEEMADQKYTNIDVDTVASASVCDSDEHKAEACSGAELEQTNSLTHSDCISSDVGRDRLQNGQPDSSVVHCDSNDEINTRSASDSCPTLSSALMNEVNSN